MVAGHMLMVGMDTPGGAAGNNWVEVGHSPVGVVGHSPGVVGHSLVGLAALELVD